MSSLGQRIGTVSIVAGQDREARTRGIARLTGSEKLGAFLHTVEGNRHIGLHIQGHDEGRNGGRIVIAEVRQRTHGSPTSASNTPG